MHASCSSKFKRQHDHKSCHTSALFPLHVLHFFTRAFWVLVHTTVFSAALNIVRCYSSQALSCTAHYTGSWAVFCKVSCVLRSVFCPSQAVCKYYNQHTYFVFCAIKRRERARERESVCECVCVVCMRVHATCTRIYVVTHMDIIE